MIKIAMFVIAMGVLWVVYFPVYRLFFKKVGEKNYARCANILVAIQIVLITSIVVLEVYVVTHDKLINLALIFAAFVFSEFVFRRSNISNRLHLYHSIGSGTLGYFSFSVTFPVINVFLMSVWLLISIGRDRLIFFDHTSDRD